MSVDFDRLAESHYAGGDPAFTKMVECEWCGSLIDVERTREVGRYMYICPYCVREVMEDEGLLDDEEED